LWFFHGKSNKLRASELNMANVLSIVIGVCSRTTK